MNNTMKKLISALLISGAVFYSCTKDETATFDVTMPESGIIRIDPISGGAVMHYKLPANKDVMGIRVRYKDGRGQEVIRTASYACDSVVLIGFDEARTGVEAFVTLCDRNSVESAPIKVAFDTYDSGPVAFFDKVDVVPDWGGGFTLSWETPPGAKGLVHVFYLGESSFTGQLDTLLMGTYVFSEGVGSRRFQPKKKMDKSTVIVRTEDYRGYTVGQWEKVDVPFFYPEQFPVTAENFIDPLGLSVENAVVKLGKQYLFDGDNRGTTLWPAAANGSIGGEYVYNTFLAGPNAVGKPFVLDLKQDKQVAQIKLYDILHTGVSMASQERDASQPQDVRTWSAVWNGVYLNKLPCNVAVYGTNNSNTTDQSSWEKIGEYKDPVPNGIPTSPWPTNDQKTAFYKDRWCRLCVSNDENVSFVKDGVAAAAPDVLTINISPWAARYRYVVIVVEKVFKGMYSYADQNPNNYVSFHELEVYTKVEE